MGMTISDREKGTGKGVGVGGGCAAMGPLGPRKLSVMAEVKVPMEQWQTVTWKSKKRLAWKA